MTNNARDEYLVFNEHRMRREFTSDGVKRAMEDLGTCAVVRRITEGELNRNVTKNFLEPEPEEYPDDEVAVRLRKYELTHKHTFGRRSL